MPIQPTVAASPVDEAFLKQKIFCVGLNKTGTTSIGDAFEVLGFKRFGWHRGISEPLTLRWHEGNFTPFIPHVLKHDAFEDFPWPLVYRQLDSTFPNARFILTTRSSASVWFKSIERHVNDRRRWVGHFLVYGSYRPDRHPDRYLSVYERHNAAVRSYFSDKPGKLLEMCFEDGDGWEKLCRFLGVDTVPAIDFPHANASAFEKEQAQTSGGSLASTMNV